MTRDPMTRPARKPRSLKTFWRDERGVSAVEFALIAPVLIFMYCGMAELTQMMMAQRRLSNTASAVGDLVAQSNQYGPTKMNDTFLIAGVIMAPFPTTNLKICVASITADSKGVDTVDWSKTSGTMTECPKAKATVTDVDVGVLPAGQSVIMARVIYGYTSPIQLFVPKPVNFTRTYYLRPRKSDTVLWNEAN
jgi:Flp pilus assembly protein TadG